MLFEDLVGFKEDNPEQVRNCQMPSSTESWQNALNLT